jgi:hypothetical protein
MILTIRTSVAAIILAGAIAVSAGVTYMTVKSSMATTVNCPAPTATAKPDFPTGPHLPIQGKTY